MMTVLRRVLATLTAVLMALVVLAPSAHAKEDDTPSSWRILRHETQVRFDTDGTAHAVTTIDFDFSNDAGHGPYLVFVNRMRIKGDPDHWRNTPVTVEKVTSPTGAPTNLKVEKTSGTVKARIGRSGTKVRGVQTYVVSYRLRGLIAPKNQQSGLDEVNWSVVGTGWQVPILKASASVELPADATRTACFWGEDYNRKCESSGAGRTVTYQTGRLAKGEGMQIVAGVPAGTFVGAEPTLSKRYHVGNMFPADPKPLAAGALAALAGSAAVVARVRRRGRDEVYEGLTPGLAPVAGQNGSVGHGSSRSEVAVRFTPPDGARPGEIGTLIDGDANHRDVVATMVDLAIRGHLRITALGEDDFRFDRLASNAPIEGWERELMEAFLGGGNSIDTTQLAEEDAADAFPKSKATLYQQVTGGRGWYKRSPETTRNIGYGLGFAGILAGGVLTLPLAFAGWGLAGLATIIPPTVLVASAHRLPARTAAGSAALAQARGFELYLRTAEADQLRWEEGEDIFSRYLPWAIAFDVADRWVKLFEQLAAQGRYDLGLASSWYYGYGYGFGSFDSLSHIDRAVESAMDSAASAAASSSDGGSGFSGGGGFGGGGGGGW